MKELLEEIEGTLVSLTEDPANNTNVVLKIKDVIKTAKVQYDSLMLATEQEQKSFDELNGKYVKSMELNQDLINRVCPHDGDTDDTDEPTTMTNEEFAKKFIEGNEL